MKYALPLIVLCFFSQVRAGDTTIKGDTMELIDKGNIVKFKGHVVLHRGTDVLKANHMETTKTREEVKASGRVELLRDLDTGEKLKAFGDRGFFNTTTGDGYLVGEKKLSHVIYHQSVATGTRVMDVYADRFDFSQTQSTGVATGRVNGTTRDAATGTDYQFWAPKAEIHQGRQQVHLTGGDDKARVRQVNESGDREIEGVAITYNLEKRTLHAVGNAQAVFVDRGPKGTN
jgi:lipopolysaccharide export system protein LptA